MADAGWFVKRSFSDIVDALLSDAASGAGGHQPLTDHTVGSAVRTLLEAFARELAVAYEQLDLVQRNAYLDTATGAALDQVVGLLGIQRLPPGFLVGLVEFRRQTPLGADIPIPAGTLVAGRGVPVLATSAPAVLPAGRLSVLVEARSNELRADRTAIRPGSYTVMPRLIAGVETVGNPGEIAVRQAGETDAELRERVRMAVRGLSTGTVSALVRAVRACGVSSVAVEEDVVRQPGVLTVTVGLPDGTQDPRALMAEVRTAIEDARPAGVRVALGAASPVKVGIDATLFLARNLAPAETSALRAAAERSLDDYLGGVGIGGTVRADKVRAVLGADQRVASVAGGSSGLLSVQPSANGKRFGNGDYVCAPFELPVKGDYAVQVAPPGVRVDLRVELDPASDAGVRRAAFVTALEAKVTSLAATLDKQPQSAGQPSGTTLDYATLVAGTTLDDVRQLRLTLVHERTGRVRDMTRDAEPPAGTAGAQVETLEPGERPYMGSVEVVLAR